VATILRRSPVVSARRAVAARRTQPATPKLAIDLEHFLRMAGPCDGVVDDCAVAAMIRAPFSEWGAMCQSQCSARACNQIGIRHGCVEAHVSPPELGGWTALMIRSISAMMARRSSIMGRYPISPAKNRRRSRSPIKRAFLTACQYLCDAVSGRSSVIITPRKPSG